MTEKDLIQIAKFVLSRCPHIKNQNTYNDCIIYLCEYFSELLIKYNTRMTKKLLINFGLREMQPRKPFRVSPLIKIKPSDDGLYSI